MKYLTIAFTLFLSINLSAQSWFGKRIKGSGPLKTITRNVSNYDKISIGGNFEIVLVKGVEGQLNIKVEDNLEQYLITSVKNNKLTIRWQRKFKVSPQETVKITIPFKEIDEISYAGSGKIATKDIIKEDDFTINMAGSGELNLLLFVLDLDCTMAGSGKVFLTGEAENFDCSKAGSGYLYAYDFICKQIDISSAGSGMSEVNVTKNLEVSSVGSGNVYYKGNPKINKIKIAGSGSVLMK